MRTITINEKGTDISAALSQIEKKGETFIIYRNGKPVADLIPHIRKSRRIPHPVMSDIKINYNPVETLTHDEWPGEGK